MASRKADVQWGSACMLPGWGARGIGKGFPEVSGNPHPVKFGLQNLQQEPNTLFSLATVSNSTAE